MKIAVLLETTSADLYRRIQALDSVIADKTASPGEKTNAKTIKKKLEKTLSKNFPDAKPPERGDENDTEYWKKMAQVYKHGSQFTDDPEIKFWAGMARSAKAAQELDDLKQHDPGAYKQRMEARLKQMQRDLANMRRTHVPGNVETAYQIKQYTAKLERFMAKEFPEKYAEIVKKREEANYKAYQARDKKKAAKEREMKAAVKKSGKLSWKEQGKTYETSLKALYDQLVGLKYRAHGYPTVVGDGYSKWKNGAKFLTQVIYMPMGEIRKAWNKLDSENQQALRNAVEGINTMGYNQQGYTEAQKKAILNAMMPYKNPKARP